MKFFTLLMAITFSVFAADNITLPPGTDKAFFTDTLNNVMPLKIGYTTDGNGHLKLLNSLNDVDDTISLPPGTDKMFLQAADSKVYPALVVYTTDGAGHVKPVPILSFTAPLTLNPVTNVVSIPAATSAVDGYLKATDWSIFNGKQDLLSTHPLITKRMPTAVSYLATLTDYIVAVTDTSDFRTITLPQSAPSGFMMIIKDESGGAFTKNITIAAGGTDRIDGVASIAIKVNYGVLKIYSNGAGGWYTL